MNEKNKCRSVRKGVKNDCDSNTCKIDPMPPIY